MSCLMKSVRMEGDEYDGFCYWMCFATPCFFIFKMVTLYFKNLVWQSRGGDKIA